MSAGSALLLAGAGMGATLAPVCRYCRMVCLLASASSWGRLGAPVSTRQPFTRPLEAQGEHAVVSGRVAGGGVAGANALCG